MFVDNSKKILYNIRDLSFSYKLNSEEVPILHQINIDIPEGEVVCLSGPSGSGKTTLLNILGLIEEVQEGSVIFQEKELANLKERRKNAIRRYHIGFIFQQFHLLPILTAEENVAYFLTRQGVKRTERTDRVHRSVNAVGLWEHRKKRPSEMSGGQRQRVAIARALAKNPDVIIADEPTASLDQNTSREILDLLRHLSEEEGLSVVVASHDPMVHSYATEHYYLCDGVLADYEIREVV